MRALDLFSAAAGGWTLGLHRAGFVTVAACEIVEWRRILYAENNPHVRLYDDVRSLTAARLVSDLGFLPDIVVGSPPCQDISVANTKGRGIDGERSRLYLEAVRLVGDCRPRWFAFENSAHLRTRGADRLLDALAALGYACEPCVVGAGDLGLYALRPVGRLATGDLVAVTPPKPLAWFLATRRYLPLDTPLMKRVMGLPGQRVCRTGSAVTVDAVPLGDALDRDRHGRPLPVWQGCRRIASGEVFLMNPSVPDSLDGRYFGPLPAATVIGTATPLYTDEAGDGRFVRHAATR